MESRNPALRKGTFSFVGERTDALFTVAGGINKSGILFVILMIGAALGWTAKNPLLAMVGLVGSLGGYFFTIFKKELSAYSTPIYAFFEGLLLGTISIMYDNTHPGIAANAMTLTFGILALMLFCYRTGLLRATPVFTRTVIMATVGIAIVYVVDVVMSLFGMAVPMIHQTGPLGIGLSVLIAGVASLNLILDFAAFENAAQGRAPKYMEWYLGFALLLTLVWIYVEMLRLLSKLSRR